jgi:glycosyltransferase involved in cell wall biosynthesis
MKIIYPYPMHISNGYTYMLSIIQFLNALAENVTVELLCLDSKENIKNYLNSDLDIELHSNLKVVQISNKKFGVKSNKLFFINNVLNYLEQYKSEKLVIYTRDFKQMRLTIKNLKSDTSNIKFVFEVHQILSQNYCREGEYKKAKEMKELEDFVFSNVDGLICITSTLSSEIKKVFPACTNNHHILPVGFNKDFLNIQHQESKKYDVIYSGNFSEWKGLDVLVEAISIIKHQYNRDVKAVLIGANDQTKQQYENQAKELDVFDNIKIVKRVEHKKIYNYIALSKVGVLSNKYDADGLLFTSPLKLYEYLGSGLKVVVSRLPSIESNVNQSLVYYATPENPESFAKEIIKALDDKSFNAQIVKDFAKGYTWKSRADRFVQFIS